MSDLNLLNLYNSSIEWGLKDDFKIKDVCRWYHEEILGWHQSYLLFKKRHIKISDKSKYPDTDDKTIQKFELALKKLCLNLAQQIVVDGEGAKKFLTVKVKKDS